MIHVLFGTHSGNSEGLAEDLCGRIEAVGLTAEVVDLGDDYDAGLLRELRDAFFIVSTWGEGDPPQDLEDFFNDVKGADQMGVSDLNFSVLALGDTSHENFCGFGKNLEKELLRHGGDAVVERVDCDVIFDDEFEEWSENVVEWLQEREL